MAAIVLMLLAATAVLASLAHASYSPRDVRHHALTLLAIGAGALLVTSTLRASIYLVSGKPEARIRAVVAAVLALVVIPLHAWAHLLLETQTAPAVELALWGSARLLASVAVVALLLLAVIRPRRADRLLLLAAAMWLSGLGLLAFGLSMTWRPDAIVWVLQWVAFATAALWGGAAGYVVSRTSTRPWTRGVAPLLLLMAMAEVLMSVDPRVPGVWATGAVMLIVIAAGLSVPAALLDLEKAVTAEQRRSAVLAEELRTMRDATERLATLERQLAHDAQGTLAGVRAAIQIWERSPASQSETSSLRHAALSEVGRLETALRAHRVELGCGPVRLAPVVDRAVGRARARGAEVAVSVPDLVALGEECDLERAVRDAVEHSLGSDPTRLLVVRAWQRDDTVVLDISHPGRSDPGVGGVSSVPGGAGVARPRLARAEHLVRRQGGELSHGVSHAPGIRITLSACAASSSAGTPARRLSERRIPGQRTWTRNSPGGGR